jgi:hypothetical protein
MRTDGQTDRQTNLTNLIVAFRKFTNAPKIVHSTHRVYLCALYGYEKNSVFFFATPDWFS